MRRSAKSLLLLLLCGMLAVSCNRAQFGVEDASAFVVDDGGELHLAVWVVPSGVGEGEVIQMEVESPTSLSWSVEARNVTVGTSRWYGSSTLLLPLVEEGEYQVTLIRSDGKRTGYHFLLVQDGQKRAMPAFSVSGQEITWEGDESFTWKGYDGDGNEVADGVSTGKIVVDSAVSSVSLSWYDQKSGKVHVRTVKLR